MASKKENGWIILASKQSIDTNRRKIIFAIFDTVCRFTDMTKFDVAKLAVKVFFEYSWPFNGSATFWTCRVVQGEK